MIKSCKSLLKASKKKRTLSASLTKSTELIQYNEAGAGEGRKKLYKKVSVTDVLEIKEGTKIVDMDISVPATKQYSPPDQQKPILLSKVTGKVTSCNFKSIVPTIELENNPNLIFIINKDTRLLRTVDGTPMVFNPKEIVKKGMKLELWYTEESKIKTLHSILIID